MRVGIYGVGELGGNTYLKLCDKGIDEILLYGRNQDKLLSWKNTARVLGKEQKTTIYEPHQLKKHNLEVLVYSASDSKFSKKINFDIMNEFEQNKGGYKSLIVASNPVDESSDYLGGYGFTMLDQARAELAVKLHYQTNNIQIYTAGKHHHANILSESKIFGVAYYEIAKESDQKIISKIQNEIVLNNIINIGSTNLESSHYLAKTVLNFLGRGYNNLSIYSKENEQFVGTPVFISDHKVTKLFPDRFLDVKREKIVEKGTIRYNSEFKTKSKQEFEKKYEKKLVWRLSA